MNATPEQERTAMPTRPTVPTPTEPTDDHRDRLTALRDRLTAELDAGPSSAAVAALARQLQSVLSELAAMTERIGPDALEALTAQRAARLASYATEDES
jgi:hypothetical protein